jgi:hypothetical protein
MLIAGFELQVEEKLMASIRYGTAEADKAAW